MKWWGWMSWSLLFACWVLSQLFKSPLSPLSRGSLVSSLLSVIRVISSAYLKLLILLLVILIPACESSNQAFGMMYTALTYSFPNLEPVHCSMSGSNCCFLTCIQISQEAGQEVWYSQLFKNFPKVVVIHTVKGFGVVNEPEVDVFLELSCFFDDPTDVGNLISGSSAFSKSSLYIWKFLVHVPLKLSLKEFEPYLASMWNEHNWTVVWTQGQQDSENGNLSYFGDFERYDVTVTVICYYLTSWSFFIYFSLFIEHIQELLRNYTWEVIFWAIFNYIFQAWKIFYSLLRNMRKYHSYFLPHLIF